MQGCPYVIHIGVAEQKCDVGACGVVTAA